MKLESVKKDSQLILAGVKFDVQWTDNNIAQVVATDEAGNIIVFKKESYDFRVLVKAKPKMEKKFLLKGTIAGMPLENIYDERYTAEDAKRDFEQKVRSDEDCVLTIEQVEVAEEAA